MAEDTPPASDTWKIGVQTGLAWLVMLLAAGIIGVMAWRVARDAEVEDVKEIFQLLLQTLVAVVMVVIGYFFGSSQSSHVKDVAQGKVVEKLTDTLTPPASPVGPAGPAGPTGPTGESGGPSAEALTAATMVAPLAAAVAAPPAAEAAAPAAAEEAVEEALARRDGKPKGE